MNGIPDCIKLEQRQTDRLKRWVKTLNQKHLSEAQEEDCCCASPLTFEIYGTGIGDVIIVKCLRQKLNLSIDDGNELIDP